MSSTTVTFRGKEFEAADSVLAVWLELLVHEIDRLEEVPPWLREARDEWHLQATAGFGFGVIPALDEFVVDDERRALVLQLSERARQAIERWGDPVDPNVLNDLNTGGSDGAFLSAVPAEAFRRVADYFIKLLRGTLSPAEVDSRIYP
jgi:hypothetical protein